MDTVEVRLRDFMQKVLPAVDPIITDYLSRMLVVNASEMTTADEVFEAVGENLLAWQPDMIAGDIRVLAEKFLIILHNGKNVQKKEKFEGARKLERTIDISNTKTELHQIDSIWNIQAKDVPAMNVDRKKLAKERAKAAEKQEKRATDGPKEVRRKPTERLLATASQAMNRRGLKEDGSGGTKDIRFEGVDISIGTKALLSGAECLLVFGHKYGLVGRNGIGKTTFLKMIASGQLIIPNNISMLSVEQEVEGDDTQVIDSVLACDTKRTAILEEERRLQEQMNDPAISDEQKSAVSARITEVYAEMEVLQVDKAPARAATILFGLGFKPDEQRKPTREFSGGWRMRVALARALFMKPDLLLLDEPTNMLDMRAVYWLENHLQEWESTILIVSHDRKFLNAISTDIIHLHSQRLDQYKGNYDSYEKNMREKLTLQQREYEAQQQLRAHVQEFIDKFRFNAKRASMVQSRIKMLEKLPVLQAVVQEADVTLSFPKCDLLTNPVLQLDEVSFQYNKESPLIFQNICVGSQNDSRICIVGENGSGKTTLLKILMGELAPSSGLRHVNRRINIGYFTQHHVDGLEMECSSLELCMQRFPGLNQEDYRAALGRFGLSGDIVFQSIETLSGGQKSRLAFACLGLQKPNYLILDEPTNHLDVETVDALGAALNEFPGGVVLVSHDERLIDLVCKELWVVKDRTITHLEGGLKEYKQHVYRQLAIQMS
ncbi:ATP-binding cassette sub-family F member 3 [Aphelenchoides fujianensis]|nr:ATP-binding cassette sub-family F member 3 [Aphelenchoides fujianensis]